MGFTPMGIAAGLGTSLVGGLLNTGGKGASMQAQAAPIQQAVNQAQIDKSLGYSNSGLDQQQAFINALNAQNGLGNQSSVFNQQQGTLNQLQGIANGTGPNPAAAMLSQATGQNVANQAALMAGQRGAGQNVGMMARQIGRVGSDAQQQAAGQAAVMQANQSLGALGQMGQQQANMGNLAQSQVQNQAGALQNFNQNSQNLYGNQLNAMNAYNQNQVGMQSNMNNVNQAQAKNQQGFGEKVLGGVMGGLGQTGMMGSLGKAFVGGAQNAAHGGEIHEYGYHIGHMFEGGMADPMGVVAGKAKYSGDTEKNDTVPAMLSPGEIVIPRSIAQHPQAPKKAASFVAQIIAKNGLKKRLRK